MEIANDNEVIAARTTAPDESILPAFVREMMDQCDRSGVSMDFVMSIFRARLRAKGFDEANGTERVLAAFRRVLEQNR